MEDVVLFEVFDITQLPFGTQQLLQKGVSAVITVGVLTNEVCFFLPFFYFKFIATFGYERNSSHVSYMDHIYVNKGSICVFHFVRLIKKTNA